MSEFIIVRRWKENDKVMVEIVGLDRIYKNHNAALEWINKRGLFIDATVGKSFGYKDISYHVFEVVI